MTAPRPAATVVLLRPGAAGLEVLLTHRPSTMAFAAGLHVFPGGRVDAADTDPGLAARSAISPTDAAAALGGGLDPAAAHAAFVAAIREAFEETGVLLADAAPGIDLVAARARLLAEPSAFAELVDALDLRLRTDRLVPLSRWVTPTWMPRRFDTRFFAALAPDAAEASLVGGEVLAHAWRTPRSALDAMAAGEIEMWIPTSATLQQLEWVRSAADLERLRPGRLGDVEVERLDDVIARITMPAGGGVAGQPVCAYLVGRERLVLVDPGDQTDAAIEAVAAEVAARSGRLAAIALTHVDPDHAAATEAIAEPLGIPILASPLRAADLPSAIQPLLDGETIDAGDVPLRVVSSPGPTPDHLAFVVGGTSPVAVLAGDLDGVRGARSIPMPTDDAAWAASLDRLRAVTGDVPWLAGHPPP